MKQPASSGIAGLTLPLSKAPPLLDLWRRELMVICISLQSLGELLFDKREAYCSQANIPNYLSIIGMLLPEDAVPIGVADSQNLGKPALYYSQELHDLLSAALRTDPANPHDCAGKLVAAGTLFVGLGGCEAWSEAPRAPAPKTA
ncbi:MAG: hypothetical protein ACRDG4_18785 [Chloroflexota bacterium]